MNPQPPPKQNKNNKFNPLKIQPLESKSNEHKSPPLCEAICLKHPFSLLACGSSGSGKTTAIINLIINPHLFRGYFHKIFLFSATGKSDDSFLHLDLPDEQVITDNFIKKLSGIIEKQDAIIEDVGMIKAPRVLFIFEDLTANKDLMKSPEFIKSFVQNRHLNISCIACVHKYSAMMRTARLNCGHLIVFPCTNSEKDVIRDEHMTHFHNKKSFEKLITYAFTPSEESPRPFLWINCKDKDIKQKFRKNLDEYIM